MLGQILFQDGVVVLGDVLDHLVAVLLVELRLIAETFSALAMSGRVFRNASSHSFSIGSTSNFAPSVSSSQMIALSAR